MIGTVVPSTANISIGDVTPLTYMSLSTLVRIQPPDFGKLADAWWFTLLAYISAFLPWALLETTDFISEEWRPVKRTRQAGYWVLGFTVTPMVYILAYCVVQGIAKDYKELWAALVALIFAFLALLRTSWGLWQLFIFQTWVQNSVENLEALGIECELPQKRKRSGPSTKGDDQPNVNNGDSSEIVNSVKISESILVNNTIIDNQLMHGSARCFLRLRGYDLFRKGKGDHNDNDNDNGWYTVPKAVIEFLKVFPLILVNVILPKIGLENLDVIQVPKKPVEIWIHWGAAFSSQVLHSWLSEYNVLPDSAQEGKNEKKKGNQSSWQRWKKAGRYFSSEVVASASMQLLSANGHTAFSNPFLWSCWASDSDMRDGRIRKSELLDIAVESGKGLPFDAKQRKALEELMEPNLRHLTRASYASYEYLLQNYIEELPLNSTFSKLKEKLTSETLEWLAVLLHLGYLAKTESASSNETATSTSDQQTSKKVSSDSIVSKGAVRNLSQQVGIPEDFEYVEKKTEHGIDLVGDLMTKLVPIPSLAESIRVASEGNRLVSKAGQLIDVWLALVSGSQLSCYSTHLNPKIQEKCLAAVAHSESKSEVYDVNVELEKDRLEKRLVYGEARHDQMDHFVTFMGYRMESVRSCLAKRSEKVDPTCSSFFTSKVAFPIEVPVTTQLESLLKLKRHFWRSRAVQCQLIWELQNEVERIAFRGVGLTLRDSEDCLSKEENGTSSQDDDIVTTALAILCILSYPSLSVLTNADEASGISTLRIRAEFGPQSLLVLAQLEREKGCQLQILNECTEIPSSSSRVFDFKWTAWRDAFSGRLYGFRRWQESIGIKPADLSIGGHAEKHGLGVEIQTENGAKILNVLKWLPFRSFCRYELESEGLLRQHSISRTRELTDNGAIWMRSILSTAIRKVGPVDYCVARDETLMEGALFIQQAASGTKGESTDHLKFGKELEKRDRWQTLLFYGAVTLQAQDVNKDVAVQRCLQTCKNLNTNSAIQEALYVVESYCGQRIIGRLRVQDVTEEVLDALFKFLEHCLCYGGFDDGNIQMQRKFCEVIQFLAMYNLNRKREKWMNYLYRLIYLLKPSYTSITAMKAIASIREMIVTFKRGGHGESKTMEDQMGSRLKGISAKERKFPKHLSSESDQIGSEYYEYFETLFSQIVVQIAYVLQLNGIVDIVRSACSRARCDTVKYSKSMAQTIWKTCSREQEGTMGSLVVILTNRTQQVLKHCPSAKSRPSENSKMQMIQQILEGLISQRNSSRALTTLADILCDKGMELGTDEKLAVKLYEIAIREGEDVNAMYNLANFLCKGGKEVRANEKRAVELYEMAICEGEHVGAMINLANFLLEGGNEVEANEKRAVELYEMAIREGEDVDAMYNLANFLRKGGNDVETNEKRALELYEMAIREGEHVGAMINLAVFLCKGGKEVEANEKRALELYEMAINEGEDVDAMINLANFLCEGGKEVEANEKRAVELYEMAIREGEDVDAMINLANFLCKGGKNVEVNEKRAVELYEMVIRKGGEVDVLRDLRTELVERGIDVEPNVN